MAGPLTGPGRLPHPAIGERAELLATSKDRDRANRAARAPATAATATSWYMMTSWYRTAWSGAVPLTICPVIIPGSATSPTVSRPLMVGRRAAFIAARVCRSTACFGDAPSERSCSTAGASSWIEANTRSNTSATPFMALLRIIPEMGIRSRASYQRRRADDEGEHRDQDHHAGDEHRQRGVAEQHARPWPMRDAPGGSPAGDQDHHPDEAEYPDRVLVLEEDGQEQADREELHRRPEGADEQVLLQAEPVPRGDGDRHRHQAQRQHELGEGDGDVAHRRTDVRRLCARGGMGLLRASCGLLPVRRPAASWRCAPSSCSSARASWVTTRRAAPAAASSCSEPDEEVGPLDIERRRGLVQQPHLGPERERPRDRDPQLLAAGERTGVLAEELRLEPGADDQLARVGLGELLPGEPRPGPDVVQHRALEHRRSLGDQGDAAAGLSRRERPDVPAVQQHLAAVRRSASSPRMRRSVVFPPPDGPLRVVMLPPSSRRSTPSSNTRPSTLFRRRRASSEAGMWRRSGARTVRARTPGARFGQRNRPWRLGKRGPSG